MSISSFVSSSKYNKRTSEVLYSEKNIFFINSGVAEEEQIYNFLSDFITSFIFKCESYESYLDSFIYVNLVRGRNGKKSGYAYVYISDERIYKRIMDYSLFYKESKNRDKIVSQYMYRYSQIKEFDEMLFNKINFQKDVKLYSSYGNINKTNFCNISSPGQLEISPLRTIKKNIKPYLFCDRIPYPIQKEDIVSFFERFRNKHNIDKSYIDKYPSVRFEEKLDSEKIKLVCYVDFNPDTDDVIFFSFLFRKIVFEGIENKFCMFIPIEI